MARVRMYAVLRESAGASETEIDAPNLDALLAEARQIYGPAFSKELSRASVAVNGQTVEPSGYSQTVIGPDDEVALLPPVSGGAAKTDEKRFKRAGLVVAAAFCLMIGLASWWGAGPLAGLAALVSASVGLVLAGSISSSHPPRTIDGAVAGFGAALFPVAAYFKGEHGLLWAGAAAILTTAPAMVFRKPAQGAVTSAGSQVWLTFYAGIGLCHLVLIRQAQMGLRLLLCLFVMVLAYKAAKALTGIPAAGIAAAEFAALLALIVIKPPFTLWPMVVVGLVVGLACLMGEVGGRMLSQELTGADLLVVGSLDALLIALPAFYYSFRLYLV